MAKLISLKEKLRQVSTIKLGFTSMTPSKAQDGSTVLIFELDEMITKVRGSQEIDYEGKRYPVTAEDITEIKIHEDDLNDDFQWDEDTDTGFYEGQKLILDVAKSTGQVWLTSTTFANSGNMFRNKIRNDKFGKMLGFKPKDAVKKDATEVVDTNTGN